MNDEKRSDDELAFGEKLLGMQGFSTERARRYRADISRLLTHRVSMFERWTLAVSGVFCMVGLVTFAIMVVSSREHSPFKGLEEARWTLAITCAETGVMLCAWMLWIAVKGGYGRRTGDLIGTATAFLFCAGTGTTCIEVAWSSDIPVVRAQLLVVGGLVFALALGCVLLTFLQRLHRQTQEKLVRIEYHLAELMERNAGSGST